ncbi:hypothetical protein [Erythrobacter crassostreae]|uniref:Uncharacterized protein n=1 Tax=Erythrobacter crassostreae TaxID=2828328 RepID=A0A9X1JKU2_9SPHN|nr:hypothetical protein [Erythrobacter crassostrea]MBV7259316.1 hypothetical protein [Erythrobacter crassostrea]
MIVTNSQLRSLGWAALLAICVGMFVVLSLRVHAVHSEVQLAERKIVSLKRETKLLETEFQTRANQRQMASWNRVDFGFKAPRADQYFDSERQLASLGQPRSPGAPSPIRVARADTGTSSSAPSEEREMVSPLSGEAITLASAAVEADGGAVFADAFGDFLIEASPIRAANAQTVTGEAAAGFAQEMAGGGE